MIIEGKISVKYALENKKRIVESVYVKKNKYVKDFSYIKFLCLSNNIPFNVKETDFFDNYPKSGGIVAEVSSRSFDGLEALNDLVLVIDGVEDPYNLGQILRSGAAFGASFILTKKNFNKDEKTLLKSSAGAFDLLNIHQSYDLLNDLYKLKEKKYTMYALNRNDDAIIFTKAKIKRPLVLIVGGEKRGINKEILNICDQQLYLDYPSDFHNALGAVSAASIALELLKLKKEELI